MEFADEKSQTKCSLKSAMKKLSTTDSSFVDWRRCLPPKRKILKFAKKTKPNNNNGEGISFETSHGSSWFRGPLLGKGSFGSVFLAKINRSDFFVDSDFSDHLPAQIAVKSSFLENSSSIQFEKKVLDDLNSCPNTVRCYGDEITKNESGKQVYNLLLEYCSGGNLYDRIAKFKPHDLPESEVRRYTRDIVYGIASIHGRRYVHCDIKPENILLLPSVECGGCCLVAKIADFGLAKEMTDVITIDEEDIRGTWPYMAPELVRDNYSDWPVDIWALGCVVLEMLTGKQLWCSTNSDSLFTRIGYSDELPEIPSGLSPVAMDFLRRCLIRSPYKRSSAWMLFDHPFIYDFHELF